MTDSAIAAWEAGRWFQDDPSYLRQAHAYACLVPYEVPLKATNSTPAFVKKTYAVSPFKWGTTATTRNCYADSILRTFTGAEGVLEKARNTAAFLNEASTFMDGALEDNKRTGVSLGLKSRSEANEDVVR